MPRLPVMGDESEAVAPKAPPPTIHLSYRGLALGLALLGVFLVGDILLPDLLALNLDCIEGRQRRRSAALEAVLCSASAGLRGWLYIAWLAAPLVLFAWWLRRKLRRRS